MESVVKRENIVMLDSVEDWTQAIKTSAQVLVDGGYIEPRYIDAILESTKKNGPYYVLAPEIAMPHASPDSGVIETQISLLVLKEPIKFSEEGFDVRLIFTLAAKDSTSHLSAIQVLAEVFMDEAIIKDIIASESVDDVNRILQNVSITEEE